MRGRPSMGKGASPAHRNFRWPHPAFSIGLLHDGLSMTDFLQLFFSGLATGSIYALAALGFTLLWQASGTINFAQGEFFMLLAVLLLGWVFKRGVVDPLFKYGMMPIVVATIGLSIALRNGVRAGYSAEAHPFPSLFADKLFNIAGVTVTLQDIGTFT